MQFDHLQEYFWPWLISNLVAVLLLLASWRSERWGRLLFSLLFVGAAIVNWNTSLQHPEWYLEYADLSFSALYKDFVQGWFSRHIREMVGTIAVAQALLALALWSRGWLLQTALMGGIIFLLAIAPLGVGAAFPFSITTSVALAIISRTAGKNLLWKSGRRVLIR